MENREVMFNGGLYIRNPKSKYYFKYETSNEGRRKAKQLHRAVWEYYNGEIPTGWQVHHIDGDVDNNDISNLQCMPAKEHLKLHAEKNSENAEYVAKQRQSIKKASEAAKAWHNTEEGLAWHRKHAEESIDKVRQNRVAKKCRVCGMEFDGLPWQEFCGIKCQRKARLDRLRKFTPYEKPCEQCGKTFIAKKVNSKFCCPNCKASNYRSKNRM